METRIEQTLERRQKGYNCAQAVACTYCDLVGMDEETMFSLTQGLGSGMGTMEGTCGAVTGACILAGMAGGQAGKEQEDDFAVRMTARKNAKEIMEQFKQRNQTVTCKELKGIETGKCLRSCADCVKDASEFVEHIVLNNVK